MWCFHTALSTFHLSSTFTSSFPQTSSTLRRFLFDSCFANSAGLIIQTCFSWMVVFLILLTSHSVCFPVILSSPRSVCSPYCLDRPQPHLALPHSLLSSPLESLVLIHAHLLIFVLCGASSSLSYASLSALHELGDLFLHVLTSCFAVASMLLMTSSTSPRTMVVLHLTRGLMLTGSSARPSDGAMD